MLSLAHITFSLYFNLILDLMLAVVLFWLLNQYSLWIYKCITLALSKSISQCFSTDDTQPWFRIILTFAGLPSWQATITHGPGDAHRPRGGCGRQHAALPGDARHRGRLRTLTDRHTYPRCPGIWPRHGKTMQIFCEPIYPCTITYLCFKYLCNVIHYSQVDIYLF